MNRTNNNYRETSDISESWDIWDFQIKQLKKRNDRLADADEMPETGDSQGETKSASKNHSHES